MSPNNAAAALLTLDSAPSPLERCDGAVGGTAALEPEGADAVLLAAAAAASRPRAVSKLAIADKAFCDDPAADEEEGLKRGCAAAAAAVDSLDVGGLLGGDDTAASS